MDGELLDISIGLTNTLKTGRMSLDDMSRKPNYPKTKRDRQYPSLAEQREAN